MHTQNFAANMILDEYRCVGECGQFKPEGEKVKYEVGCRISLHDLTQVGSKALLKLKSLVKLFASPSNRLRFRAEFCILPALKKYHHKVTKLAKKTAASLF